MNRINIRRRRLSHRRTMLSRAIVEGLESKTFLTGSPFEDRGWLSVIVDNTLAPSLSAKLAQLKQDEIADGWTGVSIHTNAPRMDDNRFIWDNNQFQARSFANGNLSHGFPGSDVSDYLNDLQTVKSMIAADKAAAEGSGSHLRGLILVGHVTVPYSGIQNGTAHEHGAADLSP